MSEQASEYAAKWMETKGINQSPSEVAPVKDFIPGMRLLCLKDLGLVVEINLR